MLLKVFQFYVHSFLCLLFKYQYLRVFPIFVYLTIDVSFQSVCPLIDKKLHRNVVKVAVEPGEWSRSKLSVMSVRKWREQ